MTLTLAALAALGSCGPAARVSTADEFITNYSEAMIRKSASRVLAMEADGPLLLRFARDKDQRDALAKFDPEVRRVELERLFKEEDIWWKAWCMTRYDGERVHGDHIDVAVSISGARSQVILVRAEDGTLRIHTLPGWVHAEPTGSHREAPVPELEREDEMEKGPSEETVEE